MPKNRLLGADFIRAGACVSVVISHLSKEFGKHAATHLQQKLVTIGTNGQIGVSLFFVLSGFLLARPFWQAIDAGQTMPSMRTYILRRGARIIPGFWLAMTVTLLFSVTLFGNPLDQLTIVRYVAGLTFLSDFHWVTMFPVDVNGPLWSISFEISSYILLPIGFLGIFAISGRGGTAWVARASWALVILTTLIGHWAWVSFVPHPTPASGLSTVMSVAQTWSPWYNPFGFFAIFATGAIGAGIQTLVHDRGLKRLALGLAALLAIVSGPSLIVSLASHGYGGLKPPYLYPIIPLAVVAFLVAVPEFTRLGQMLDNRLATYVAKISFGIYVWHALVIALLSRLVFHGEPTSLAELLRLAVATFAIAGAIAAASFRYLEFPITEWARKFERKPLRSQSIEITL